MIGPEKRDDRNLAYYLIFHWIVRGPEFTRRHSESTTTDEKSLLGVRRNSNVAAINHASGDDRRHRRAFELPAVERRVARLARRVGGAERPGMIGGEEREVGGLALGDAALAAQHARRPAW